MIIEKTDEHPYECPHCGEVYPSDELHMCPDTQDGDILPEEEK